MGRTGVCHLRVGTVKTCPRHWGRVDLASVWFDIARRRVDVVGLIILPEPFVSLFAGDKWQLRMSLTHGVSFLTLRHRMNRMIPITIAAIPPT